MNIDTDSLLLTKQQSIIDKIKFDSFFKEDDQKERKVSHLVLLGLM